MVDIPWQGGENLLPILYQSKILYEQSNFEIINETITIRNIAWFILTLMSYYVWIKVLTTSKLP